MEVNPYESPREIPRGPADPQYLGPWRDGTLLVCRADAKMVVLPPWCAATGVGPIKSPPIVQLFDVTPRFALVLSREMLNLAYNLEPAAHWKAQCVRSSLWGCGTLFGGTAIVAIAAYTAGRLAGDAWGIVVGAGTVVALTFAYYLWSRGMYEARFLRREGRYVWFAGIATETLTRLPEWSTAEFLDG